MSFSQPVGNSAHEKVSQWSLQWFFMNVFCPCCVASQTSTDTTSAADDNSLEEKPAKKSKKGKKVQWPADDANLATFHFFEMDEDERGQSIQLGADY